MIKAIIGAGGFAMEVRAQMKHEYRNIPCFVDDKYWKENTNDIYPLSLFNPEIYEVLVAVGDPKDRFDIVQRLPKDTKYFTYAHPSVQILGDSIGLGEGSFICANSIITTNVKIGKHAHINLATTIGHDCIIGDYFTTAPGVNISGHCTIYDMVYIGSNASIKQETSIHSMATIGMGACVVNDICDSGTYVGMPAKRIK